MTNGRRWTRRRFLKAMGLGAAALRSRPSAGAHAHIVKPLPKQVRWQDFELGLAYHFDLDVYMPGGHHHERSRRERLDRRLYKPAKLDTDQWLEAAKAAGARYAIFTATHHQGFLQWQSDVYPFGLKEVEWRNGKGDIVRDFVESSRKYDIAPGIYIGIRFNAYWQVYNYEVRGGKGGDPARREQYMRVCERIVEELCSRYGPWCEIWFDGGVLTPEQGGPDVLPIVEKHQPDAVFYHSQQCVQHRWAGSESGTVGYPCWSTMPDVGSQIRAHSDPKQRLTLLKHGDPDGKVWCPAMADAPIREHDWLWVPNTDDRLQPLDRLREMYCKSVGHNANLILGAVPNADGLIPEADFHRYAELGREIRRRFGKPVAQTSGREAAPELQLPEPATINCVTIAEDIRQGERVRRYVIDGLGPGNRWRPLCEGTSIGHKRIHEFETTEVARLRIRVTRSIAEPIIRSFAAYSPST